MLTVIWIMGGDKVCELGYVSRTSQRQMKASSSSRRLLRQAVAEAFVERVLVVVVVVVIVGAITFEVGGR